MRNTILDSQAGSKTYNLIEPRTYFDYTAYGP